MTFMDLNKPGWYIYELCGGNIAVIIWSKNTKMYFSICTDYHIMSKYLNMLSYYVQIYIIAYLQRLSHYVQINIIQLSPNVQMVKMINVKIIGMYQLEKKYW